MPARPLELLYRLTAAPNLKLALRRLLEYAALRLWTLVICCFPIEMNLVTARWMGRLWWVLRRRNRETAIDNLRHALGDRYDDVRLREIARRSFEHFAQVFLVEFAMSPRIVNRWSWPRYVELGALGPALRELLSERGTIMITPHFGNFELLGHTICELGLPLTAVMRPLDNPLLNELLVQTRHASGLTLIIKRGASTEFEDVLRRGGTLCFIADQDAGRKGIFVDFFGRKASVYKSIGLAAIYFNVPVIVGHAIRTRCGFRYRIEIERIIQPREWADRDDPLRWLTTEYTAALEASIRRAPEQYLWAHRRWKHRPKEESASLKTVKRRDEAKPPTSEERGEREAVC
jgi:KDO2-lipid IV(A) lauroyltransferase